MIFSKKSQIMFEFLLVISLVIVLFMALSYFIFENIQEKQQTVTNDELDILGKSLQEKMFTVSNMNDGLHLQISLPELVNKKDYSIYILNDYLYVSQGEYEKIYFLPQVNGDIFNKSFILSNNNSEVLIE